MYQEAQPTTTVSFGLVTALSMLETFKDRVGSVALLVPPSSSLC